MKIKSTPEDFQVAELADFTLAPQGEYALYLLHKRNLGTPEALELLAKQLGIGLPRFSFGGLKDKHAATKQHVSVYRGPRKDMRFDSCLLEYLGQVNEPFQSRQITGNRFQIRLRHIPGTDLPAIEENASLAAQFGLPNYFDDQRFGSVTQDGQFVARKLIEGDYESALRLALCAPYEFDPPTTKQAKNHLRTQWGAWRAALPKLPQGDMQRVVAYLAMKEKDFRGALLRLPHQTLTLHLAAFQSHLWNRILSRWFVEQFPSQPAIKLLLKRASLPMPDVREPAECDRLFATQLPLPSARLKLPEDSPWRSAFNSVLEEENLTLPQIQVKHIREVFFSKGERAVWFAPTDLALEEIPTQSPDRCEAWLRFTLPRGCYATLLLKRLQPVTAAS